MTEPRRWMRSANFGDVIRDTAALYPERTALIADGVALSYAELDDRAARMAAVLSGRGIGRRDVVALGLGNDWRFVECFLGVLRVGAVALLVNVKLGPDTLRYMGEHSEAKLLLAAPELAAQAEAMAVSETVWSDEDYEGLLTTTEPLSDSVAVAPDDVALLMYTSGSTGWPKGVMLTHSNTWWQARSDVRALMLDGHDRGLVMGPLYHANALWSILLPMLFAGGGVVVLPTFDPAGVLEAIDRHRVTMTSGTPSMFALLLAHPALDRHDGSSLELLLCGSAPVTEELMGRITERFGCDVVEGYGLTEGGANIMTPRWGVQKLGSTGLPVPDVEIRVVDPTDPTRECETGEIGELWTRSPANALGYLKQPEATAEKFVADGWLRTGDLFLRDEQGYCYFRGRTDDMISVGGENVYPKEVETIVLSHPDVADVGVVPVAHPVKGEAPVAFVVPKAGVELSEEAVRKHFLANGPAYANPRRVFFVDALPISSTNKMDRSELKRRAGQLLPDGLPSSAERSLL
jgi:long-chain acyl-CoA synthetase